MKPINIDELSANPEKFAELRYKEMAVSPPSREAMAIIHEVLDRDVLEIWNDADLNTVVAAGLTDPDEETRNAVFALGAVKNPRGARYATLTLGIAIGRRLAALDQRTTAVQGGASA